METNGLLFEGEIIKPIEDFPHYYISNFGRTFTTYPAYRYGKQFRLLRERDHPTGYRYVGLYRKKDDGGAERKWLRVHRLVYHHFKGPIKRNLVVDHMDENKSNNHISNLQLLTVGDNINKSREIKKLNKILENVHS
jgi:hypothetical protein